MNERRSLTTRSLEEEEEEEQLLDSYCTPAKVRPQTIAPPPQTIAPPFLPPNPVPFPPPPKLLYFFSTGTPKAQQFHPRKPPSQTELLHPQPLQTADPKQLQPQVQKAPLGPP